MKTILFITPTWVNIHEDIIRALVDMGYDVVCLPEFDFSSDPYKIRSKHPVCIEEAEAIKTAYWKDNLDKIDKSFDYLLAIDGAGINSYLFEELKHRNSNIYCVNYLYDTTYSMYHFEHNFHFYDHVFTFDRQDAVKHKIDLLPIYWVDVEDNAELSREKIFGFGAYSPARMRLYSQIANLATNYGISHFIKLYHKKINSLLWYGFYLCLRKILHMPQLMSIREYKSGLISTELIPTSIYRQKIKASEIVLDTKVQIQDGLTARCMWALGLGKKIITTNHSIQKYNFFSNEQVLVVEDKLFNDQEKKNIVDFINTPFKMPANISAALKQYRIDNWLKTLLQINE